MIRIAVTGSHSVGKSTLIARLHQRLLEHGHTCRMVEEPIAKLGREIRSLDLRSAYMRLIGEHFNRLDQPGVECCLYDRSLLDVLVYFRASKDEDPGLERLMVELLPWHQQFIDLYIYLPIEIPLEPDARRPPSESLRRRVDSLTRDTLAALEVPLLAVTGSVEQRAAQALERMLPLLERRGA